MDLKQANTALRGQSSMLVFNATTEDEFNEHMDKCSATFQALKIKPDVADPEPVKERKEKRPSQDRMEREGHDRSDG